MKKISQYELVTTKSREAYDMPIPVLAKNRKEALKYIKRRLLKGEKILSLKKVV